MQNTLSGVLSENELLKVSRVAYLSQEGSLGNFARGV